MNEGAKKGRRVSVPALSCFPPSGKLSETVEWVQMDSENNGMNIASIMRVHHSDIKHRCLFGGLQNRRDVDDEER